MIETATNSELYKLVIHDAPYVIAAYGVIWLAMVGYVTVVLRRLMHLQKEVAIVAEAANVDLDKGSDR